MVLTFTPQSSVIGYPTQEDPATIPSWTHANPLPMFIVHISFDVA